MDAFSIIMRTPTRTELPKKKLKLSASPLHQDPCNRQEERLGDRSSTGASRFTKCCVCSQNVAQVLLNDHLNACLSSFNPVPGGPVPSRQNSNLDGVEPTVNLSLDGVVYKREALSISTSEAVRQHGTEDQACEGHTSQEDQDIQSHSFAAWLDSQGSVMSSPTSASQPELETPHKFRRPLKDLLFTFPGEHRNIRGRKVAQKLQLLDTLYCSESLEEAEVQHKRLSTGDGPVGSPSPNIDCSTTTCVEADSMWLSRESDVAQDCATQDSLGKKGLYPLQRVPQFPQIRSSLVASEPIGANKNEDSTLTGGMVIGTELDQKCGDHKAGLLSSSRFGERMASSSRYETRQMSTLGDKPSKPINLLEEERHQQARISLRGGQLLRNSDHMEFAKARSISILQPGMVLMRNRLSSSDQQRFVKESQALAQQFYRPATGGGRKYHLYSATWGPRWDGGKLRFVPDESAVPLPDWLFMLARNLAAEADSHSPVLPARHTYSPDVGLINYYPAKAQELGVVALGGHQDLDDTCHMPVVSASVGDSMTFFYRRLPPFARRKSGVRVSMGTLNAQDSVDGDASHNSEHSVVLASGDVVVFGGQSRLVYHGTRNLQPGSKPLGLRMAPGRLNFTFRQRDVGTMKSKDT